MLIVLDSKNFIVDVYMSTGWAYIRASKEVPVTWKMTRQSYKGVVNMASMVPYRSVFGVRPSASSLFDLFDDMSDLANSSIASKAFPVDVEDKGDGYEVKAYLTGVAKDDIDVELNEGRLSISVNVEEDEENEGKNFLQKEFSSYSATRGVYLKDASSEGLSATLVVQSSSATIAVLQNFASQAGPDGVTSVIGLGGAIPILFGDNIGTTITALLASIGQSKNAKRTAVAHSVFNITGSIVFMFLIPVLSKFVRYISPKGNEVDVISRQIANAHTTFNIVCTLVWLPLIPVMVKIVKFIVRGDEAKEKAVFTAKYLDDKLINQPTAALYLVSEEIKRSASYAAEAFSHLKAAVTAKKDGVAGRKFNEYSEYVKVLQESISTYISKMFSSGNLTELQSEQTAGLLCVSNNIVRIAERCDEIDKSYENLKSKGYKLSNEAINEVKECMELSGKLFEEAIEAVATGDDKVIDKMTRDKNKIRKKNRQCSKAHFGRVKNKKCSKAMSGDYTEILQNIGRITDNCVGIAEEAMDNVKFMTLNAEEMEQYGNVIDFSQAKQVEGTEV